MVLMLLLPSLRILFRLMMWWFLVILTMSLVLQILPVSMVQVNSWVLMLVRVLVLAMVALSLLLLGQYGQLA